MPGQQIQYDPGKDYYAVLSVWPHASREQLLRAYRCAVKRHHPDVGGDPTGRMFRLVCEAYSVLSDAVKRAHYNSSRNRFGPPITWPRRRRRRRRSWLRRASRIAAMIVCAAIAAALLAATVAGTIPGRTDRPPADSPGSETQPP